MGKKLIRKGPAFLLVAGSLLGGGCAQFPTPGELIRPPAIQARAALEEAAFDAGGRSPDYVRCRLRVLGVLRLISAGTS